jgi:hypothetical protein
MEDLLEIYTLFDHPEDYPNSYVIKRDLVDNKGQAKRDDRFHFESDNIETCRNFMIIDMAKVPMAPMPGDDPVIIETYI